MTKTRSRKGTPGIVEVAARAGVSIATVSRAFNSPQMVVAETRKRIETAAKDLGYHQDLALGPGFSGTIGMIVPTIDNAIFSEMIEAFSRRLNEHGRTMLIATHGYDLKLEVPIMRALIRRKIDGVVLVGLDHLETSMAMLLDREIPTIAIWNYDEQAQISCIGADNRKVGACAMRHLLDLGHRDIAMLFPDTGSNDRARHRFAGAIAQAAARGINIPAGRIISCPYDIGASKKIAIEHFSHNRPGAVLCGNDVIAQGVLYGCLALGLTVPRDLSVMGIGDFATSAHIEPGLSTIRIPARRIGEMAAETIVSESRSSFDPRPVATAVDFSLVIRKSTQAVGGAGI